MFKKILLPVDMQDTGLAERALQVAIGHARASRGRLHILAVVPGFGMPLVETFFPPKTLEKALEQVGRSLEQYIAEHVPDDVKVTPAVAEGTPWEKIVRHANRIKADLVIMPSHNRKRIDEVLIGSCSARVAEQARCSVLIVRGPA